MDGGIPLPVVDGVSAGAPTPFALPAGEHTTLRAGGTEAGVRMVGRAGRGEAMVADVREDPGRGNAQADGERSPLVGLGGGVYNWLAGQADGPGYGTTVSWRHRWT